MPPPPRHCVLSQPIQSCPGDRSQVFHSYGTEDPGQAGPGCAAGGNAPSWPWRAISSAHSRRPGRCA